MKKINLLLVFILLMSLFSVSVLAAVPTAGETLPDIFADTGEFFRGLFTGSAKMENASFIAFILYFILFLAVFMEGLRHVGLFGSKGELNKQGKIFAVAAAALSTISLYLVEQGTQKSTAERVEWLIAPFGIWGGVVIAGIVAFITYKLIRDSDLFKDKIITAMAIAAAVGVTFVGFLLGLENLLGWGFLIMLLVFIVGFIRAFGSKRKEAAEGKEAKVERAVGKQKKAEAEKEEKKEKERKEDLASPIKDNIKTSIECCDEIISYLDDKKLGETKEVVKEFGEQMHTAWHNLRLLRRKMKEEGEREQVMDALAGAEAIRKTFREEVKKELPSGVDEDWAKTVKPIRAKVVELRAACGAVWKKLEKFHK